jgi:hypothetical protein
MEFSNGCSACNNGTISDYISMPCANITASQQATYCTATERIPQAACPTQRTPVCGNSFRLVYNSINGTWSSGNGTMLPFNGNSSFIPGKGEFVDGELIGSTELFGNFLNNYNKTNFNNRCDACLDPMIDFVTDGECQIFIPIPIPVFINQSGMMNQTNSTNSTLPLVAGQ